MARGWEEPLGWWKCCRAGSGWWHRSEQAKVEQLEHLGCVHFTHLIACILSLDFKIKNKEDKKNI